MSRLTLDDLRLALAQRPTEELEGESDDDRLLWFFALDELAPTHEDSTVKNIARMFVAGIPKLTVADVREWLDAMYDEYAVDCERTEEQVTEEIMQRVRDHLAG